MGTCEAIASAVLPANIVVASTPMIRRVAAALRLWGGSNPGIPFDTASTPVSAVQPDAKARKTRKTARSPPVSAVWRSPYLALSAVIPSPKPILMKATASIAYTARTNP
jgi:hypothetical protein